MDTKQYNHSKRPVGFERGDTLQGVCMEWGIAVVVTRDSGSAVGGRRVRWGGGGIALVLRLRGWLGVGVGAAARALTI